MVASYFSPFQLIGYVCSRANIWVYGVFIKNNNFTYGFYLGHRYGVHACMSTV